MNPIKPGRALLAQNTAQGQFTERDISSLAVNKTLETNDIAAIVFSKFTMEDVYTRIGDQSLLFLNPARNLPKFSDEMSKQYLNSLQTGPHIFETTKMAYTHMIRSKEDQSIILCGQTGSGKSLSSRLIVRHFCDLGRSSMKKSKVQSAILKSDGVLSAFGNSWTNSNIDATSMSKYTEYQFDPKGNLVGAKFLCYFLDKAKLTDSSFTGWGTFHIFYYLLAGSTLEERKSWSVSDNKPEYFNYLSNGNIRTLTAEDSQAFTDLRGYLKALGIGQRQQAQVFQILSAILHLGNISFVESEDKNQNLAHECYVKNYNQLAITANLLGLDPDALESVLTIKTKFVKKDLISILLDVDGAEEQRDALARTIYSVLMNWIIEQMNQTLCREETEWANFISVLDSPGFDPHEFPVNDFNRLLKNYSTDCLQHFILNQIFQVFQERNGKEGLKVDPIVASQALNSDLMDYLQGSKQTEGKPGLLNLIDVETNKGTKASKIAELIYSAAPSDSSIFIPTKKPKYTFAVNHYGGTVEYDTRSFEYQNLDTVKADFVNLIRGNPEQPGTVSGFIRSLFSDKLIATQSHYNDPSTLVAATNKLARSPSIKRSKTLTDSSPEEIKMKSTVASELQNNFQEILNCISETKIWFVFHLASNDKPGINSKADYNFITKQLTNFKIANIATHPSSHYVYSALFSDFLKKFALIFPEKSFLSDKKATMNVVNLYGWLEKDVFVGEFKVFLSHGAWKQLEENSTDLERQNQISQGAEYSLSTYTASDDGSFISDNESHYSSEFDPNEKMGELNYNENQPYSPLSNKKKKVVTKMTSTRRNWLIIVWLSTFYIPPFLLTYIGRMPRQDQQIAWREKFTLCLLVFLLCGGMLFLIAGLNLILCPNNHVISPGEASDSARTQTSGSSTVYMYGNYYVIPDIVSQHLNPPGSYETLPLVWSQVVLGQDVTDMFSKETFWKNYCPSYSEPSGFQYYGNPSLNQNIDPTWYDHTLPGVTLSQGQRTDYLIPLKPKIGGKIVWDQNYRTTQFKSGRRTLKMFDAIYDMTGFYPTGAAFPYFIGSNEIIQNAVKLIFDLNTATDNNDATAAFQTLKTSIGLTEFNNIMTCMNGLFLVAYVDHRGDAQCVIPNYVLLAATILLGLVIVFKFLAALQFGQKRTPIIDPKFVICQVPCYTEGEDSLLKTINSLAQNQYDDKHKILFIIADGMIIGTGNDRPTPRIVLDILGVDQSIDPIALKFESIGDGNRQLNFGKVYSGLYEIEGHAVPFIVIVKVGQPSERSRPGNRGKRDSQLILMRFLSRVHFNQEMSPLELEIYHQMKNVIGVDPSLYEYVLMVDADTTVYPDAINRLVACMIRDGTIMGICGETRISNQKKTFWTMIQVYEYFISHHMAKAFESLFGSVTCLPGCFSMYRLRTPLKNVPLLLNAKLIVDYSQNTVETLHMKNLLHLGEDRYLTTLMLKYFPYLKTKFTGDAKCETACPEKFKILMSQRRRWINSTVIFLKKFDKVHNLLELVFLPDLCGCCCFSMRFVVFLDLFATLLQPATLFYLIFLVFMAIYEPSNNIPLISIILLAAIYGFQIFIFLMKREWDHLGWIILYLIGSVFFTFFFPIYSFWHFDDFSWGSTRRVIGENNKIKFEKEVEPFDPASIEMVKWSDHQEKLIDDAQETGSIHHGSIKSPSIRSYRQEEKTTRVTLNRFSTPPDYLTSVQSSLPDNRQSDNRQSWATNFSHRIPRKNSSSELLIPRKMPTNQEIFDEVKIILSTADLMTVTKKQVRQELNIRFGMDVSEKKDWIHKCIDKILTTQ